MAFSGGMVSGVHNPNQFPGGGLTPINQVIALIDQELGTSDWKNPGITADQTAKLAGIEAQATADQTGQEIAALLDAELGSEDWRTGGPPPVTGVTLLPGIENALANVATMQAAIDLKGRVEVTVPGDYYFQGTQVSSGVKALSDYAILHIGDDTELYTAPGVNLLTPPKGSGILAKPLFCNKAVNSNSFDVAAVVITPGNINLRYHLVEIAVIGHNFVVGDTVQIRGDCQPNEFASFTGAIAGTTLTVTAHSGKQLYIGAKIEANNGSVEEATFITAIQVGSGGNGTYTINNAHSIAATAMTTRRPISMDGFHKVVAVTAGSVTVKLYELTTPGPAAITGLTGSIVGQVLTVTNYTTDFKPQVGMFLSGSGVIPGTVITKAIAVDANGLGTYNVSLSQNIGATTFTVRPTICKANTNIVLDLNGDLDNGSNTDCVATPFVALGYMGIQFNKVGNLRIKNINTVGWQTIACITNYDNLVVDRTSFKLGAVGYFIGAGKSAALNNMQSDGEEAYYIFTSESSAATHFVSDQDGRLSLFGNVGAVSINNLQIENYTYAAVRVNVSDGFNIGSIAVNNVVASNPVQRASFIQIENVWNIGGDIGMFQINNADIDPRGGTIVAINPYTKYINIASLSFVNVNVFPNGRDTGLVDSKILDCSGTSGSTIGKLGFTDCVINFDCINSTTTIPAVNMPFSAYTVGLFTMDRVRIIGNGNTRAIFGVNTPAAVSVFTDVTIEGGASGGHILTATGAHSAGKKAIFTRCRSQGANVSLYMALFQQNFTAELNECSVHYFGNLTQCQGSGYTLNLTYGGCTVTQPNTYLINGVTGSTYNIRSKGGNVKSSSATHVNSALGTWNLIGNCSDLVVNLNQMSRAGSGGSMAISGVAAGTIVVGNLVVCDMTNAANSWKQLSDTTLTF